MTVATDAQTLTDHLVLVLSEFFGDEGGMKAYHHTVAENLLPLLDEEFYVRSAVEASIYDAYLDAVSAAQIAQYVDTHIMKR